jgi:hypothetical protein
MVTNKPMNWTFWGRASSLLAMLLCGVTGCSSSGNPQVTKERGVYTTTAVEGRPLDMPGGGYQACRTFSHGIMPAAVVTGYGYYDGTYNHPQSFTLQVVEAATGTIIITEDGEAYYGKAAVIDLPVRKSGNYHLKLLMNHSVYDTWDFTVSGDSEGSVASNGKPPAYATGNFTVSIDPSSLNDAFTQYDETFDMDLVNAAAKEAGNSDRSIFSQIPPGKVVIRFNLDDKGQVHDALINQNTLNEDLGKFFLGALKSGTPYKSWPASARATLGSGTRMMVITYYLD